MAEIEPYNDETLLAFAWRSSVDLPFFWTDYQRVALGASFDSCRSAERKFFEWERLEQTLGIPSADVFAMSERSFYTGFDDLRRLTRQRLLLFPWTGLRGYPAYSPAALKDGDYLRLTWLRPDMTVDLAHNTVFLQHCPRCHANLGAVDWKYPAPLCPVEDCQESLCNAPIVKAPARMVELATHWAKRFDPIFRRPIDPHSPEIAYCSAVWYATNVMAEEPLLGKCAARIAADCGIGDFKPVFLSLERCKDVAAAGLRRAQLWMIADHACTAYPDIVLHRYELLRRLPRNLSAATHAIRRGLFNLAAHLGVADK